MAITGVSSLNASQPPSPSASLRSREDAVGRQLEQAINSGDLAGAQQAYNALSAFGPNNSGPFSSPKLSQQFADLGQALQAGDLGAAKQAADKLGKNLLIKDFQIAKQDFNTGGWSGAQKAISHLEGDFWAVTGKTLEPSQNATGPTNNTQPAPAINVKA
jgi:hypothetical protein